MKNYLLSILALFSLAACGDATKLTPVKYNDLSGWKNDSQAEAFRLFTESCHVNATRSNAYQSKLEGPIGVHDAWFTTCAKADQLENPSNDEARHFFETNFAPYKVETESRPQGTMTGYYEPLLHGSKTRHAPYLTPVYGVPYAQEDMTLFCRADIASGALKGKAPVLLYVDDPIMLFFLQVQGSGKVRMTDGKLVGLQYAGQNGHEYVAIGRILKERGELDALSMQTIRDWLLSHPDQMNEVLDQNPSYVYFKLSPGDQMAKGAIGVPLTPLRSLAIDDDRATYGVPTYVDTTQASYPGGYAQPLQRLFVSQDTGGALHGPHRGDIFYGRGEREEWQAGHQNAPANVYWLLPLMAGAETPVETPPPASETMPIDAAPAPVMDESIGDSAPTDAPMITESPLPPPASESVPAAPSPAPIAAPSP